MIEALALYLIFCVATAITSVLSFWNPVVKEAKEAEVDSSLVAFRTTGTIVYFFVALVFAPAMFVILFNKNMSYHYIQGLKSVVNETDE